MLELRLGQKGADAQQGRCSPTLDRSLPSLPLRSVAVKRGSAPTLSSVAGRLLTNLKTLRRDMKESFEASLTQRVARAGRIRLQHFIPQHWFSAAASECVSMFVAGQFY